ncbi:hypothetical protein M422DRAFT_242156 [Sphaerobolus stellatus SS14]|nr:hypothetical protein M422DRAFT_242156 [Sphaerobolus stellatus SS14]
MSACTRTSGYSAEMQNMEGNSSGTVIHNNIEKGRVGVSWDVVDAVEQPMIEMLHSPGHLPISLNLPEHSTTSVIASPTIEHAYLGNTSLTPLMTHQTPRSQVPLPICDLLPSVDSTALDEIEDNNINGVDMGPVPSSPQATSSTEQLTCQFKTLQTLPNKFGVYRKYEYLPTHRADIVVVDEEISLGIDQIHAPVTPNDVGPSYFPFPNESSYKLSEYYYRPGTGGRSAMDFNELCRVVGDPSFIPSDVYRFSAHKRDNILESFTYDEDDAGNEILPVGGWQRNIQVPIQIPEGKENWTSDNGQTYYVPGLHHKSITEIVRIWFETKENLHYTPFELWWKQGPDTSPIRIYADISSSDALKAAHKEINTDPAFDVPGCSLERVVGAVMISSDATHLAQFGSASLWPIYAYPGNLDSTFRMSPHTNSDEHWAYIPSLPAEVRDFVYQLSGQACSKELFTHCKRELVQSIWRLLLDDDFRKAYKEGIVVKCADGVMRRVYIRLITYSADYPEKMLMLSLRDKGKCVCPRCLIPQEQIRDMGMVRDRLRRIKLKRKDSHDTQHDVTNARSKLYGHQGMKITSKPVDSNLQQTSRVPTINAFSEILPLEYFNKYEIFVVDLLHEFELGVWKGILVHLIRILTKIGLGQLNEFDRRFRQIPTYGRDTIRNFANKVSDLKKLAARDFEDILQCCLPVFEGLFLEPHETIIHTLLMTLAEWHALAKLRMHTETTLQRLEAMTTKLGQSVRKFASVTCPAFDTEELGREFEARKRRIKGQDNHDTSTEISKLKVKKKSYNFETPKFHFLGDYTPTIRWVGTTPGYSTQMGERSHKKAKQRYAWVSKATPALGMTRLDQRETNMRNIRHNFLKSQSKQPEASEFPEGEEEALPHNDPKARYVISSSRKYPMNIGHWLHENQEDIATENFYDDMKTHLYGRLTNIAAEDDEVHITQAQRDKVLILRRVLYKHQTCRINFTTYDMQRSQDSINPSTSHRDIMLHARDDHSSSRYHPYWYARVIGIFHCLARLREQPDFQEIHFLWIRWLGRSDTKVRSAVNPNFLDQVGFVTVEDETDMFGFVDPANVIRACHLIPAFHYAESDLLKPGSVGRNLKDRDTDYLHYYVNRFVDRDMYMRYLGGGIGHTIHFDPTAGEPENVSDPEEEELPEASFLLINKFLAKQHTRSQQDSDEQVGLEPQHDNDKAKELEEVELEELIEEPEEQDDDNEDDEISVCDDSEDEEEAHCEEGYIAP